MRLRPTPEVMRSRPTVWPRGQFGLEALTSLVLSSNRLIFLYSIIFREKQGTCIPNYGEGASRVFASPDCIQHVPRCQESQSGGRRHRMQQNPSAVGTPPRTPLGELTAIPRSPGWWGRGWLPLRKNPTPRSQPFGPHLSRVTPVPPLLAHSGDAPV